MKKFLIPILLILASLAAYWVAYGQNPFSKIFGGSSTGETPGTGDVATIPATTSGGFNPSPGVVKDAKGFPLSIGSRGAYVENMQKALNEKYGSDLDVDGIFGTKTAKALSAHGFNPDAIYWKHYFEILG